MEAKEFVEKIKAEAVDRASESYARMYSEPVVSAPETDFFQALNEHDKKLFLKILRDVQIDTLAGFLSYLDGDYWLEGQNEDVVIHFESKPTEKLNGDLADMFLESVNNSNT